MRKDTFSYLCRQLHCINQWVISTLIWLHEFQYNINNMFLRLYQSITVLFTELNGNDNDNNTLQVIPIILCFIMTCNLYTSQY